MSVVAGSAPLLLGCDILHHYGAVHDHRAKPSVITLYPPACTDGLQLQRSYFCDRQDTDIFDNALCAVDINSSVGVRISAHPHGQATLQPNMQIQDSNYYSALKGGPDSELQTST